MYLLGKESIDELLEKRLVWDFISKISSKGQAIFNYQVGSITLISSLYPSNLVPSIDSQVTLRLYVPGGSISSTSFLSNLTIRVSPWISPHLVSMIVIITRENARSGMLRETQLERLPLTFRRRLKNVKSGRF